MADWEGGLCGCFGMYCSVCVEYNVLTHEYRRYRDMYQVIHSSTSIHFIGEITIWYVGHTIVLLL
jgi:hypothetical protein